MKPISAEDIQICKVRVMDEAQERVIGIAAIFASLAIAMAGSFGITNFQISDTDVSSYMIVVMLMIFAFLIFYAKDKKLKTSFKPKYMLAATASFIAYALLISYSRLSISYLFLTYRVDMLLLPLLLFSMIIAIFGFAGVQRMKWLIIYSIFASPVLFVYLLSPQATSYFAIANAKIVYSITHIFYPSILLSGSSLTMQSGQGVSIASSCIDPEVFIALLMFLLPLAYFYDGSAKDKLKWLIVGLALLIALNLIRIGIVVFTWASYGLSASVAFFHTVAGPILFYLSIVVMVLAARFFNLKIPKIILKDMHGKSKRKEGMHMAYAISLCMAFGIVAGAFSLPYMHSLYAPFTSFNQTAQQNYAVLGKDILASLEYAKENITELGSLNGSLGFAIGNSANAANKTYVIATALQSPSAYMPNLSNSTIISKGTILLRNGIAFHTVLVSQNSKYFAVNYFAAPVSTSTGEFSLNYEFIREASSPEYSSANVSTGFIEALQTSIFDAINGDKISAIRSAYIIANSFQ
ncbi:MAG: archaeosortase/exosortase family protein [Candidatus Micrarchaeaceae archaeon]